VKNVKKPIKAYINCSNAQKIFYFRVNILLHSHENKELWLMLALLHFSLINSFESHFIYLFNKYIYILNKILIY